MKKYLSLVMLLSICMHSVNAETPNTMKTVDLSMEFVKVPECLAAHQDMIATMNKELRNDCLDELLECFGKGCTTTYKNLDECLQLLNEVLAGCKDQDLMALKNELATLTEMVESHDKSLFVNENEITRKSCCCNTCISSSCGSFTVNGALTTSAGITVKTGNIKTSAAGAGLIVGGGAKVVSGTGSPSGSVTAPQGSLYLRLDGSSTSTRAYINTDGGTTWTAITTAA